MSTAKPTPMATRIWQAAQWAMEVDSSTREVIPMPTAQKAKPA